MVLEIALGIIIAYVVLSLGRDAVWLALIVAAFYFGFGGIIIALAVLTVAVLVCAWTFMGLAWLRKRLLPRGRGPEGELEWYERKEPTIKSNGPQEIVDAEFVTGFPCFRNRRQRHSSTRLPSYLPRIYSDRQIKTARIDTLVGNERAVRYVREGVLEAKLGSFVTAAASVRSAR